MGSLLVNFTPSTDNTAQSYRIKYKIKDSISYNVVNPEPISSPVTIPNIDTSYAYEGTIESNCGYGIYSLPLSFTTNAISSSLSVLDVWYSACTGCTASIGCYFDSVTIIKQGDSTPTYTYTTDNFTAQKTEGIPNLVSGAVYVVNMSAKSNSSSKGISALYYSAPGVNTNIGINANSLNKTFTFTATSSNNNVNIALSSKGPVCECSSSDPEIGCFKAGTLITLTNGLKVAIEDIKENDQILSFDNNQHLKISMVNKVQSYLNQPVYLKLDDRVITTTADHLFLTEEGYIRADKLKIDSDIYILINKKLKPKTILESTTVNEKIQVYNINCEPYHTFFADDIAVHD